MNFCKLSFTEIVDTTLALGDFAMGIFFTNPHQALTHNDDFFQASLFNTCITLIDAIA